MTAGVSEGAPAPSPNEPRRPRFNLKQYLVVAAVAALVIAIIVIVVRYRNGADQRRYEAVLRGSLDRLVTAQEGFYYDSTRYTASLRALPGVQIPAGAHVQIFNPDRRSWWGIATHDRLRGRHCVVWVGTPPISLPADARAPEEETKPLCFEDSQGGVRPGSRS
jgi:hypothetical protein